MGRKVAIKNQSASESLAEIGQQIKTERKVQGLSSVELSLAAGISRTTLHRIENGESSVNLGALVAAMDSLGLSLEISAAQNHVGIPEEITISDFPELKEISWHMKPSTKVKPLQAWNLYKTNWRYLDESKLTPKEVLLISSLRDRFA